LKDTVLCLGQPLRLSLPGTDLAYTWSNGSTLAETTIDAPGSYWVEYRRNGTSCSRRETFTVSFRECLDDLYVPNVITPNGDQANDTFVVRGASGTTWALQIFSRWGKEVARYDQYKNDWDAEGTSGGVYYYILTSRVSGKIIKGWIQVLK
jgi:gliding motility-associated-like protein